MKVKAINLKMLVVLLAILITLANWRVAWSDTPFHNQTDCTVCHDFDAFDCGTYVNIKGIKCTVNSQTVDFRVIPTDYFNGTDGICDACHDKPGHHYGEDCTTCHGSHCPDTPNPGDIGHFMTPGPMVGTQAHATHESDPKGPNFGGVGEDPGCQGCHLSASGGGPFWDDATDLASTTVCDTCHSPDGAFPGVDGLDDATIGAKANWADGIYETDGITPKAGKEQWCGTCHDDQPANITGVDAPNVIGNNTTYGFYVTGHNINCLSCHDASKSHIDSEHRTYESGLDNYQAGYRLRSVDGAEPMNIPRPVYTAGTNPQDHWQDFALCFDCHNRYEVVGWSKFAISNTNFRTSMNAHYRHIGEFYSNHFDSDWDGVADSTETCITCHNVHGSSTPAMVRDGKLISTYGTTDKVPALNFAYLIQPTDATATWPFPGPDATYYVYARWTDGSSRASNAEYTINYNGGSDPITVSQKTNGGTWNQLGTSSYSFVGGNSVVLDGDNADGWIIADAIGWDADGSFTTDPEIVVDNTSATYTPSDWPSSSWASGYYGTDYQYYVIPSRDSDATLADSLGGNMDYAGKPIYQNGVCQACHGAISYIRTPFLGPKVLDPNADPDSVPADGLTTVTLTCTVLDHNNNVTGVTIDLSSIGGGTEDMVDQGGGLYSYQTTVPEGTSPGVKSLLVTATDLEGTGTNYITLTVTGAAGMPIIIDNVDGTPTGTWYTSSWAPGYYGDNYHYHLTGTVPLDDTFSWTIPSIDTPGTYEVLARWTSDPSRAPDATYTIYHDGAGSPTSVQKDQRYYGGEWVSLGTFDLDGVGDYVELSENSNGIVVADAIMIAPPTVTVIVDNSDGTFTGTWGISTWSPGYYGADYHYHETGTIPLDDTFTWTPTITTAGTYEVFARWTANPSRASDATYIIYHDGAGSPTSVPKDQRYNGGEWVSLGTFDFDGVGVEKVELTENSNGYVIADVIKWELQ